MKKIIISTFCLVVLFSCKKEVKTETSNETISTDTEERTAKQSDGLTLLKGDYVYHGGAAVLQTHAEIYGVLPTHKFDALNEKAEAFKTESTDMVQIEIRGKITKQKHAKILWENKVEVMEILNVKPLPKEDNNIIKLGS